MIIIGRGLSYPSELFVPLFAMKAEDYSFSLQAKNKENLKRKNCCVLKKHSSSSHRDVVYEASTLVALRGIKRLMRHWG